MAKNQDNMSSFASKRNMYRDAKNRAYDKTNAKIKRRRKNTDKQEDDTFKNLYKKNKAK